LNVAPAKIWIVYKRGKRTTSFNFGKVARVHGKKVHERGGIDPLILDIEYYMEINGQLEAHVALHREKSPWYSPSRRLEGRKGGLDALGKAKSIAPFWNRATTQPVAKSQYPLCYPGSLSFNVLV
jgi:hypothetical protein